MMLSKSMLPVPYTTNPKQINKIKRNYNKNWKEDKKYLGDGWTIEKIMYNFRFLLLIGPFNTKITLNFTQKNMIYPP